MLKLPLFIQILKSYMKLFNKISARLRFTPILKLKNKREKKRFREIRYYYTKFVDKCLFVSGVC